MRFRLTTLALLGGSLLVTACDEAQASPSRAVLARDVSQRAAQSDALAAASARDVVQHYRRCTNRCFAAGPDTNEATCRLQCVYDVAPGADDEDDAARACLESLAACLEPCDAQGRETDAVTCRLQCENQAVTCLEEDSS